MLPSPSPSTLNLSSYPFAIFFDCEYSHNIFPFPLPISHNCVANSSDFCGWILNLFASFVWFCFGGFCALIWNGLRFFSFFLFSIQIRRAANGGFLQSGILPFGFFIFFGFWFCFGFSSFYCCGGLFISDLFSRGLSIFLNPYNGSIYGLIFFSFCFGGLYPMTGRLILQITWLNIDLGCVENDDCQGFFISSDTLNQIIGSLPDIMDGLLRL